LFDLPAGQVNLGDHGVLVHIQTRGSIHDPFHGSSLGQAVRERLTLWSLKIAFETAVHGAQAPHVLLIHRLVRAKTSRRRPDGTTSFPKITPVGKGPRLLICNL
jgi:hypothetical protein